MNSYLDSEIISRAEQKPAVPAEVTGIVWVELYWQTRLLLGEASTVMVSLLTMQDLAAHSGESTWNCCNQRRWVLGGSCGFVEQPTLWAASYRNTHCQ